MTTTNLTSPKVALIIMDGWGLYKEYKGNAIALADTPTFDKLWAEEPTAVLEASGESVGLPQGQMGTSEVNHFTIGAGKVMFQDLVRINKSIADGSFFDNTVITQAVELAAARKATFHIIGLLSDGGVHSHQEHIHSLIEKASHHGLNDIVIHVITDGRDTSPYAGKEYIQKLSNYIETKPNVRIGSIGGRYFAMDRDHNWERTDAYYHMLTVADHECQKFNDVQTAIETSYVQEVSDEFVVPARIQSSTAKQSVLQKDDVVVVANFRSDRPQQLVRRLLDNGPEGIHIVTMTEYHPDLEVAVVFPPQEIPVSLGQLVSEAGLTQLRVTETEKFPHVTYFMNCKQHEVFQGEDRLMFDSYSDIPTHDLKPQMRAIEIATAIAKDMSSAQHNLIIANVCNADMVGHTGNIPAAQRGCETVDEALGIIVAAARQHGYVVLITADHGNAEIMLDEETGQMLTSHTLNPVPLIIVNSAVKELSSHSGSLIDIAPTILGLLGLSAHQGMTGKNLLDLTHR